MAWNPDNDGISFSQLDKELRDIINSKVGSDDYRSFADSFSRHQTDHTIHLSSTDRERFQYAYEKIVQIIDTEISDAITDITSFNTRFANHVNDSTVHFTDIERNRWENNFTTMVNNINILSSSINNIVSMFDGYTDATQFNEQVTSLANHLIDRNVHITTSERATWNGTEARANNYSDNKLSKHATDDSLHFKANERFNWNQHKDNSKIHLDDSFREQINTHLANATVHVTSADKTKWNGILNELATISSDITTLKAQVLALQNKVK